MTERQAEKHAEREMTSREKRRLRAQRTAAELKLKAVRRQQEHDWLGKLAKEQEDAKEAAAKAYSQALESRRSNPAIPSHAPKGIIGRVKSFFQRGR